jgi:hypothetical protein
MGNNEPWPTVEELLPLSNVELGEVDPVVLNLVVAEGIPVLADLDIGNYVQLADQWAADLTSRMPACEAQFRQTPECWKNDIDFFRLGLVCWYVDEVLGIAYKEDHRNVTQVIYTDPGDLFLNGVMDTRRGTCGNLSLLHVVLGRRIGLPVSLACVGSHFLCRFDNGTKTINIETTDTGRGGFASRPDDYVLDQHNLPAKAQDCGSDLRAVTPREMLGLFLGLRARHLENIDLWVESELDYLLARYLFPHNRQLYINQNQVSVHCSTRRFEPHEKGHPMDLARWLQDFVRIAPWTRNNMQEPQVKKEKCNGHYVDTLLQEIIIGGNIW